MAAGIGAQLGPPVAIWPVGGKETPPSLTYDGREPVEACALCGGELWAFDGDGVALCEVHARAAGIVEVGEAKGAADGG